MKKPNPKGGRKRSTSRGAKAPAGQGASRLRNSVNKMVGKQSDAIVQALIDGSIKGNPGCARLIFEVSGAKNAAPEIKKKRGPQAWVKRLCSEPEWEGPWDDEGEHRDASKLPLSDYDVPDDLK